MKERLKLLRKTLGYSQDMFGSKIGVTNTAVSKMEIGTYNMTDSIIKLICKEFDVNEIWLRTGEGEMFRKLPEEDEMAAYISELLQEDEDNPLYDLIKEALRTYYELDTKSQEAALKYLKRFLDNIRGKKEEG